MPAKTAEIFVELLLRSMTLVTIVAVLHAAQTLIWVFEGRKYFKDIVFRQKHLKLKIKVSVFLNHQKKTFFFTRLGYCQKFQIST